MNQEEIREIIVAWLESRAKASNFLPGVISNLDYYGIDDNDIDGLVYTLEERINEI